MTNIENITRRTDSMTVRDVEYTAIDTEDGIAYRYTEIHSDGVRALRLTMERSTDPDMSWVTVWFARVDTSGTDVVVWWHPAGTSSVPAGVMWVELSHVTTPASAWHHATQAYSRHMAPSLAATVLNELAIRAVVALAWDDK